MNVEKIKKYKFAVTNINNGCLLVRLYNECPKLNDWDIEHRSLYENVSIKIEDAILYFSGNEIVFDYISDKVYENDFMGPNLIGYDDKIVTSDALKELTLDYKGIHSNSITRGYFRKKTHLIVKKGYYERKVRNDKRQVITSTFNVYTNIKEKQK